MCLGCAVYSNNSNESYEKATEKQNNQDYDNKNYGE